MSLQTRVKSLESAPGAIEPPIVVYVGGNDGGMEYPGESEQAALARCGISPDSERTIIFVKYTRD